MFKYFQDDLLQVVVGERAEAIIDKVERDTLQEQPGFQLSKKAEVWQPFCTLEFIGAVFDTSDHTHIKRRPAEHILRDLADHQKWFSYKKKTLAARK